MDYHAHDRSLEARLLGHDASTLACLLDQLPNSSKAQLALSCKAFRALVQQSVTELAFESREDSQLGERRIQLAGRFPNLQAVECRPSNPWDLTKGLPTILEAAACLKTPLISLTITYQGSAEANLARTIRLAGSSLGSSLRSLELVDNRFSSYACDALGAFTNLTRLVLGVLHQPSGTPFTSLAQLTSLQQLEVLMLGCSKNRMPVLSCSFLSALTGLRSLSICTGSRLDPLARSLAYCSKLQSLTLLSHSTAHRSLLSSSLEPAAPEQNYQCFTSLTSLTSLDMEVNGDLSPLASCINLQGLHLSGSLPSSASSLSTLTAITSLHLHTSSSDGPEAASVLLLKSLSSLQDLTLNVVDEYHLQALAHCPQLSSLSGNWVPCTNQETAGQRPQLRPLPHIKHCKGSCGVDTRGELQLLPSSVLSGLTELRSYNDVEIPSLVLVDLATHCKQLRRMWLSNVADSGDVTSEEGYAELAKLPCLRELFTIVNTVEEVEVIASLKQLTELTLKDGSGCLTDEGLMPLLLLHSLQSLKVMTAPLLSAAAARAFVFGWQHMADLWFDWDESGETADTTSDRLHGAAEVIAGIRGVRCMRSPTSILLSFQ